MPCWIEPVLEAAPRRSSYSSSARYHAWEFPPFFCCRSTYVSASCTELIFSGLVPPPAKRRSQTELDEAEEAHDDDGEEEDEEGTDNLEVGDLSKTAALKDNQVFIPRSWLHDGYLYLAFHRVKGVKVSVGVSPDGYWLTLSITYPELKPRDLHINGSYLSSSRPEFTRSAHLHVPEGARVSPTSEWLDCANDNYSLLRFRTIPDSALSYVGR